MHIFIIIVLSNEAINDSVHVIVDDGVEVYLPLTALIDVDKEIQRLNKQQEKLQKDIVLLENKLNSKGFLDKAPQTLVDEVKSNLQEKRDQSNLITQSIANLLTKKV